MQFIKKIQPSTIAICITVLVCLLIDMSFKNWRQLDRIIESDVHWYYGYLPATFIYNDIKLEKSDYRFEPDFYLFWLVKTADGKKIIKTTMGLAFLYAPFFFVAHGFAILFDYPLNGFSEPYKILLLLSAIFYLIIGLSYLKKILRHYSFSDHYIAITILLLGLGTNLLCYSSQSATMPHVYCFCLISIFIYYTIKWYELQSIKNTLVLGLLFGLISLIRPSNIIIVVFFIFYNISNWPDFKQRMLLFKKKYLSLVVMGIFTLFVWCPQFMYWKTVTGNYIMYSYTDEGFFFSHPRIIDGLFSFRKGWLIYTPLMAFALIGIFFLKGILKKLRVSILLFTTINIYIIFSWWCWWYGGTYGQRSLIDSYAILAIPLASFTKYISEKKWYFNALFYCVCAFLIWLNVFQTYQFEYHSLHWDGMNRKLYFKQFGKMEKVSDFDNLVAWPNYEEAKKGNSADIMVNQGHTGKSEISKKTIQLKSANDRYVCADGSLDYVVFSNKDKASTWETFSLVIFDNNECAIHAYNDKFLCAELNQKNEITATRTDIGNWETFTIIELGNNMVAFKASNKKYISMDEQSLQLFANADTIGNKEKFKLIILDR